MLNEPNNGGVSIITIRPEAYSILCNNSNNERRRTIALIIQAFGNVGLEYQLKKDEEWDVRYIPQYRGIGPWIRRSGMQRACGQGGWYSDVRPGVSQLRTCALKTLNPKP